jgi:hypothetical protein
MAGTHRRNTGPMLQSLRCGARTRSGGKCRAPAVAGKTRCRMHGGAKGSGAPGGNRNALKHGAYTAEAMAQRAAIQKIATALSGGSAEEALADIDIDSLVGDLVGARKPS